MEKRTTISFSRNPITFWLISMPTYLWDIVSNETIRLYHLFSIPELIRTLFAPWKRDETSMEGLALSDKMHIMVGNLATRLVALIIRSVTILIGLAAMGGYFTAGVIIIGAQVCLPIVAILFIWLGLR